MIPAATQLGLRRPKDYLYAETVNGRCVVHDPDAYNFSNSSEHDNLLQNATTLLQRKVGDDLIKHILGELLFRKTYGALSEMAAYEKLDQLGIDFVPQVKLSSKEVVNPNGSTLDGQFNASDKTIFFDIKGFGFVEHKISILKRKL